MAVDGDMQPNLRLTARPTGFGLGYAVLCLGVFLVAVNYANNLVYALCFLLVSLGLNGLLLGFRNAARVEAHFLGAQPVFAGQSAAFRFLLSGPKDRDCWSLSLATPDGLARAEVDLEADRPAEVTLAVPTESRGLLRPSYLTLSSRYPLGLIAFRRDVPLDAAMPPCLVYPTPLGKEPLPSPTRATGKDASPEASDPAGARPYRAGDPLSRIDWKASARSPALLTKEFDGGERDPVLRLDLAATPGPDLEARLSQLCAWVLEAQRRGLTFGVTLPGLRTGLAADHRHVTRCLRALALFGPSSATDGR